MRIGITGPVSLAPVRHLIRNGEDLPPTYSFPLIGILARELHARGHEVVVFAGSDRVQVPVRFSGERIVASISPRRRSRNAYDFYRWERKYLLAAMVAERCDVIHAHWTYEFAAAALASGIPTLVTAHDAPLRIQRYFLGTKGTFHWIFRFFLAMWVLHKTSHLTVVSPYVANHITGVLGVKIPVHVVPNGVDDSLFAFGERRLAVGQTDFPVHLATVLEGFSERKNARRALQAFALLRKTVPSARMNMYGVDFGPDEAASSWAHKHRLGEGVTFMGKVGQKNLFDDLTKKVAVLFHPALEEAHPMAICEAMALGVPVIAGKFSGGVPYTLDGGSAGVLVDVRSPRAMAGALEKLLGDPLGRQQVAEKACCFALQNFCLHGMVEKYLEIYTKILCR